MLIYSHTLLSPHTSFIPMFATFSLTLIMGILIYILFTYPLYIMAKKANIKNPKHMFIPVLNTLKLFHLADYSTSFFILYLILTCIPLIRWISFIFMCIMLYKVFEKFGLSTPKCVLGIFFPIIIYWYIALSKDVHFVGTLKDDYRN